MKQVAAIIFGTAVLLSVFGVSSAELSWRPIHEITESEIGTIAAASHQSRGRVIEELMKKATHFATIRGLVAVYYIDGNEGYYGGYKNQTAFDSQKDECFDSDDLGCGFSASQNNSSENQFDPVRQRASEIYDRFAEIWAARKGDSLTPDELSEADALMTEFMNLLLLPAVLDSVDKKFVYWAAHRGNRYLELFEITSSSLTNHEVAEFYAEYIIYANDPISRTEDRPDESQVAEAIKKLTDAVMKMDKDEKIYLDSATSMAVKRIDPQAYALMKQLLPDIFLD